MTSSVRSCIQSLSDEPTYRVQSSLVRASSGEF